MRRRQTTRRAARGPGFTLLELLTVMVVIGIIIAFILSAAMDGVRRGEERATQALLEKLETGLTDRIDALMATRADANDAHAYLAGFFPAGSTIPLLSNGATAGNVRAQIIARFDQIKAEVPDVFVVQNDTNYPLNFAAAPFSAGTAVAGAYSMYLLPLGVGILDNPANQTYGTNTAGLTPISTGIFGASYTAAAGLYKNLVAAAVLNGATPPSPISRGYDGVDNDGNGLIDDLPENGASVAAGIRALLANHTHKTARSEMLYALLVEGQGPFGSAFSREDFSDREVKDTDNDGLPEFVDAWGEPIQFYRWPIAYVSDTQKGMSPYLTASTVASGVGPVKLSTEPRQQNPLDPNQSLLDPAWWSGALYNTSAPFVSAATAAPLSTSAYAFQVFFTNLTDPNASPASLGLGNPTGPLFGGLWDRAPNALGRRAYYSRFLILSGGPDKTPGVPVFDSTYYVKLADYTGNIANGPVFSGSSPIPIPTNIDPSKDTNINNILNLRIEGQAAQATYVRQNSVYYSFGAVYPPQDVLSLGIREAGNDDITSYGLQGTGGVATQ
jgi:prepilin-type N-terminal cleavage/methylation domain-containing protein